MKNVYLVIDIVISTGLLSLAVVSLTKQGYKNSINRLFTAFSILVAIWIISNNVSNNIEIDKNIALYANYMVFASSFGVVITLMQFIVRLANAHRLEILVKLASFPLWAVCLLCSTPLMVKSIAVQGDVYAVEFGPLVWLYTLGLVFMITQIIYGIIHGLRYSKGKRRQQLVTISTGLAVTMPLVLLFSFIIPSLTGIFSLTEFGIVPMIILVISLYYGVVKYSLLDIKFAAVRTIAYILSLGVLTGLYFLAAFAVSKFFFGSSDSSISRSPIDIALVLLVAFSFQPIKHFFDRITNKLFFKDNYSSSDFFSRLNRIITLTTDLRGLLEGSADEIASTLKIEQVFFVTLKQSGRLILAGTDKHSHIPHDDIDKIDDYIVSRGSSSIVKNLLSPDNSIENDMSRLMTSHKVEIIVPLLLSDQRIGYLFLGDKKSSNFNTRDVSILEAASDELTIAIQNALAVQEIREFNETLQQRIANATKELRTSNAALRRLDKAKDEFVSMASHQLRTPLTSIKGYISMVIEGDAGKISDMQKQLLNEAFISSERMVHLISDFLNVSRIQTGKFIIDKSPVDLAKAVGQEIDSLQSSAIARSLKYEYKAPKDLPIVNVDEGKLRQVIMNFADNALYYSRENTVIEVNLYVDGSDIVYTVKDTGIGVPHDEQAQLFTKFYRASNAKVQRPDGTGVGLYLAKRIINGHGGKVIFKSVEGKGSTFGFRLPIE